MRNSTFALMQDLSAIALFLATISATAGLAEEARQTGPYLSLRHSLIPLFGKAEFFPTNYFHEEYFPMNRLNPSARTYARAALSDDKIASRLGFPNQRGAIWLLGFLGDKSDLARVGDFVDKKLQADSKLRTTQDEGVLLAADIGYLAGAYLSRKVKGADEFVQIYGRVGKWVGKKDAESPEGLSRAKERLGNFLGSAYYYSKDDSLWTLITSGDPETGQKLLSAERIKMLGSIKSGQYDTIMKGCKASQDELNVIFEKCLKTWGKEIDLLISDVDAVPGVATFESSIQHGDTPKRAVPSPEPDDIGKSIAAAVAAYEGTRVELAKPVPDPGVVSGLLADNGDAIDQKRVQQNVAEFNREITKLCGLLALLDKKNCAHGPATVSTTVRELLVETARGSGSYTICRKTERVVAIPLLGSEELAKSMKFSPRSPTVVQNGPLLIYMVEHDGRWLWNPFGW
jgi:hypothetical protein